MYVESLSEYGNLTSGFVSNCALEFCKNTHCTVQRACQCCKHWWAFLSIEITIGNYKYPVISFWCQPPPLFFSLIYRPLPEKLTRSGSVVKNWLFWISAQAHVVCLPAGEIE